MQKMVLQTEAIHGCVVEGNTFAHDVRHLSMQYWTLNLLVETSNNIRVRIQERNSDAMYTREKEQEEPCQKQKNKRVQKQRNNKKRRIPRIIIITLLIFCFFI